ncbi:extracellular solute-binding protein [Rathayibacter sp. VKM Ac-2929]|uniref:ABC transporter substrate-binding protein n=1 Tax=Rathayibacter sp. VKM Ac-2929 TaxID=2929480 RepID=UPI001FB4394B|nr:extracellular solute-binding protein [Rathayibacter sp. VKM Ac-2929]MCJ1675559.1 extracellular solute-binding protein [Rathayibacter sp. VKM Ac-2929]
MRFHSTLARTITRTAAATAVIGLAVGLAGCSNGSSSAPSGDATSGSITWWGWTPDASVGDAYIAEFNKVYPDIEVTYKNFENGDYNSALRPGLTSNSGPDVFDMAPGGDTGSFPTYGDFAFDLRPALEEEFGASWADQYTFSPDSFTRDDDSIAAVPMGGVAAGMLWVDQDLLDEAGVAAPTTYDEWVDVCAALKSVGKDCMAMGAVGVNGFTVETWRTIVASVEPGVWMKAIRGDVGWDDPAFAEGLTILKKMQTDGIIPADVVGLTQYPDANNAFLSQNAAMVQMGTWYAQYSRAESASASMSAAGVSDPKPFTQLPVPFPDVAGNGDVPGIFGEVDYGLAVNARSKNTAAATTFALWLTSTKEGAQTIANAVDLIPGLVGVEPQWDDLGLVNPDVQIPAIKDLYSQVAAITEPRNAESTPEQLEALNSAAVSVLEGSVSPDDAIDTLVAKIGQ